MRKCKDRMPTHKEAALILKQLEKHPEMCENCNIKPCTFAQYVYGK